MATFVHVRSYRDDIDGLRAIAVLAVIAFHFGYLPNGFLGVDVFFVISGFLITGIIYSELIEDRFSMTNFYLRRIRRIIPLALFISVVSLVIGMGTMLPDDLENLAQSVVATNLFGNNILQAITTKNYWDVVNEYKPLMHTWSLGIEEQYYLVYPLLFLVIGKNRCAWLLPILSVLTISSLALYLSAYSEYEKFYLIQFRFYELSIGGVAAIVLNNKRLSHEYSWVAILSLISMLCFDFDLLSNDATLLITVLLTLWILVSSTNSSKLSSLILENKLLVYVGTISFSLYMWHQVLLSYARYIFFQELHAIHLLSIFILTVILSVFSYCLVEQPFRNKNRVSNGNLLLALGIVFIIGNSSAFYIYLKGGVLKDIPELGISVAQAERNIHAKYNANIYGYDNNFKNNDQVKVLVIGNSFARDWVNVLLESKHREFLDVSYVEDPFSHKDLRKRANEADVIFYSTPERQHIHQLKIDESKLFIVGTKNYGVNSGIFYNYSGDDYYKQRTFMEKGYMASNEAMKVVWKNRYIDYIGKVIDETGMVPVFTPSGQFISQDCRHFTKAGALYFAHLFENELAFILHNSKSNS